MSFTQDMLICLWSQIINDPTTKYRGYSHNPLCNTTLVLFNTQGNAITFMIQGKMEKDITEIDKSIYFKNAMIISISITRLPQE